MTSVKPEPGRTLFIGLGTMGRPMVTRYAPRRRVLVRDVDEALAERVAADVGATVLPTADPVPDDVRTVILMVPNSHIVEQALHGEDGVLRQLRPGSLVIDMGSSEPISTRSLAREASERGVAYVDAPVSGGVAKAHSGELTIMVGGEQAAVDSAMDLLRSMGTTVMAVGPAGAGHTAKALNNLLAATNLLAVAEVVRTAAAMGIDPSTMVGVLNASSGRNRASEVNFPRHVLSGTYDSGFALDLMVKDMRIGARLVDPAGEQAPIVAAALESAEAYRAAHPGGAPDYTEFARPR